MESSVHSYFLVVNPLSIREPCWSATRQNRVVKKSNVKQLAQEDKLEARFVWSNCPFSIHNEIEI